MKFRKVTSLLLVLLLLTGSVFAADCGPYTDADADGQTLEELMTQFMEENGLDESNFSLCYYNTVTGEQYRFNERWFAYGASTYKLPLNLYFYELENAGEIDPDMVMTQGGARLSYIHEESIVNSNNELSFSMVSYLGGFEPYKRAMLKYFSIPEEEIEDKYWYDHVYCTEMMIDVLQYLYERQEQFPELMGYLKQAVPDDYFRKYITDCEVAHKYGDYNNMHNDVGIIYAGQPFLLAVYTFDQSPEIVSRAAALAKVYTDHAQQEQAAREEAERLAAEQAAKEEAERLAAEQAAKEEAERLAAEEAAKEEAERLAAEQAAKKEAERLAAEQAAILEAERLAAEQAAAEAEQEKQKAFEWWMIAVALGVFLLGGGGIMLGSRRKGRLHEMLQDAEQEQDDT